MSEQVKQILSELEDTALLLQKAQTNLKKCPKQRLTRGYIEARLKTIEEYWNKFIIAHHHLVKYVPKEQRNDIPYFANEDYFILEDLYLCIQGDLRDLLSSDGKKTAQGLANHEEHVKLPRIVLPTFSGDYDDWPAFQDLYTTLVHQKSSLSSVQKLHYLKTSVTGEAAALLKHIQITESNYSQAWQLLKSRYGNKRLIVNSLLKKLFMQKKIPTQTANHIKTILDTTSECINSLSNLNVSTDSWDPLIIFLVSQKLDPESHRDWEEYAYKDNLEELPKWTDLVKFLEAKYRTMELIAPPSRERVTKGKECAVHMSTEPVTPKQRCCLICKENHTICHCKEFTKMQPAERCEYIKSNNLCFNCLAPGHSAKRCRLHMSCRICHKRHHTLVHETSPKYVPNQPDNYQAQRSETQADSNQDIEPRVNMSSYFTANTSTALLATALVPVRNTSGQVTVLRALVDHGSQATFISERAAQILRNKRTPIHGTITGVGSTKTVVKHACTIELLSRYEDSFSLKVKAYVMPTQLTTRLPSRTITISTWSHLKDLVLADPGFHRPGQVDLLLGVDACAHIMKSSIIKGPPGTPCAQDTSLGWILFGHIQEDKDNQDFTVMHINLDVDNMLKQMWEIDTVHKRVLTKEERLCEQIYEETHTRTEEGRYIVRLPFKTENVKSLEGNTKDIAHRRLLQLEKRFRRDPDLKEIYTKVMKEYTSLEHMEEIPEKEAKEENTIYLPHHAVVRNDKETSKTRVVFDASAKGYNQVSLNDELLVGPQLQEDLRNIIMRWRMKRVCYASDIQKMYRQILVFKEDANTYQRILWRENESDIIKEYRLLRVTFGTASAPYLAVKTLHQVAEDEGQASPKAAGIIKDSFYMDDLMAGEDTSDQAIETAREIYNILKKGGFTLSKWSSNCPLFMRSIEPNERTTHAHLDINIDGIVKALGLVWNLRTDQFQYQLKLPTNSAKITKRTILSDIQKLFDPLGWIAPSLVIPKMLIQKLWLHKVEWDDPINSKLEEEWMNVRADLENVSDIRINRWLDTISTELKNIQIHGFSDASMQAYAAAAYIRVEKQDGSVITNLLAARTRLAPLRTVSLPRLELCGALLLSRLLNQIGQAMRVPTTQMYAWSDSSIVIAWLSGEPHRWKTFVANRVVEINENLNNNRWYHVSSEDNPADIASRGTLLAELKENKLWWKGPEWLTQKGLEFKQEITIHTDLEMKQDKIQANLIIQGQENEYKSLTSQFNKFSNLQELLKVIIFCRRFLNFKGSTTNIEYKQSLTTEELDTALTKCIKLVQQEEYKEEIDRLKVNKPVKGSSNIKSLNPYLDTEGTLRVGGRLRHADLEERSKHPIILGNKNSLVPLIVADAHTQTLHGGVQLMLCHLRFRYWIIRAKGLVKMHIHKCLVCARQRAIARTQIMGDLPKPRVTPTRAFLHSGVDYAGPFQIVMSRGRGIKTQKGYIAIFVCMSTKAIHLEVVGDLTSEAFIAAFKRFVARRGRCSHIWSDQGRNFVGADKELLEAWKDANLSFEGATATLLALEGTQWHFIPAYSPNFGGLWEAGVKSLKHHLKRVLTTNLTFEEMTTVLCQVEACLNSRPLCPIDDTDPDCVEPLTPGHFLIGEAPIVVPSPDFVEVNMNRLSRWQYTQKLLGDIWRRWQQEYLTRLQQRPTWLNKVEEFQVGDIVLIKSDGLPPGKWSLGRITNKHPGDDGCTRVYSVKSGNSIVKRSISKLCYLPIDTV